VNRRRVLRLLAAGGGLVATGALQWVGCAAGGGNPPETVSVGREEVEREGRVVVRWQRQPVEVRATRDGFEARSLVCTHIGCTVRWVAAEERYACPCHEGFFDDRGNPIGGPPKAPLRSVPVLVTEDKIIVGA
jgi:Rieske Fe-S protein